METDKKKRRIKIWKKMGVLSFAFVIALYIMLIIAASVVSGCDMAYLPWNSGPSWTASRQQSILFVENEEGIQGESTPLETENFCDENQSSIEQYRIYLNSQNTGWANTIEEEERRREYLKMFIVQYDNMCGF